MMHGQRVAAVLACLLVLGLAPAVANAAHQPYAKFYGEYRGVGVTGDEGELKPRDLTVKIAPARRGFTVKWTAEIYKSDGEIKRVEYDIRFAPTRREHVYGSAMRMDVFGHAVPLDPLSGDPYVWARIEGKTLTVYALIITDTGRYELQEYDRTLTPTGMHLRYSRVRNGKVMRTVTGELERVR